MLNTTIREIADGYLCFGEPKYQKTRITRVSFDSRQADGETLFVPIVGSRVNAHRFVKQVLEETECKAAFISEDVNYTGDKILITCSDTVGAVQGLAMQERARIKVPVIGVTGSVGKTTTREMIAAALRGGKRVYTTAGNHNSQIGVAQTIFEFDESAEIAVLELGMSMPGEMQRIAGVADPDIAVFTNIGVTHIENLGSRENILEEKMHITDYMPNGGPVFVNHDNDLLRNCRIPERLRRISYGTTDDCDVYADQISFVDGCPQFLCHIGEKTVRVQLRVYGEHQVLNAVVALAVADSCGVDPEAAAESLGRYEGFAHRQQIRCGKGFTVIDDSYNAAPDSMKAALQILAGFPCEGRRIAVLGDMKELGAIEEISHREIGAFVRENTPADLLITFGTTAELIGEAVPDRHAGHFTTKEALDAFLQETVQPGDVIVFKGSNSLRLFDSIDTLLNS